jgi:putative ABC transport system permease protein
MPNLLLDLKYGLRTLLKTPGFSVIAVLTLALGIGANTAIFSVIESVLLRQIPYHDPDRLVMLWGDSELSGNHRSQVSFTDVEDWRRSTRAFEDIAAFARWNAVINGDVSERVPAVQVSDSFFRVMGAKPLLGRLFLPEDQIDGRDFVVVITHELWRDRFGADPKIVGRSVRINSGTYTVVGVLPAEFASLPRTIVDGKTAIYRPCAETYDLNTRDNRHFRAIGRLKQKSSMEQAQSEISLLAKQLARSYAKSNYGYGVRLTTLREDIVGNVRPALLLLYGGVVFVLLIGCANLANLLLARFTAREREISIRAALGATRTRLITQLVTESLILALIGGMVGLILSTWLVTLVGNMLAGAFPILTGLHLSPTALVFTAITSLLAGLTFGVLPAVHGARSGLMGMMKSGGSGSIATPHGRLRSVLVSGEVALALVLLACAGLLFRTVQQLHAVDPGFRAENVITSDLTLPYSKYGRSEASVRFYDELTDRLRAVPGVENVGVTSTLPLTDFDTVSFIASDKPARIERSPSADRYLISPDYLRTMGITLKAGRFLTQDDTAQSPPVIVVNETLARQVWPGQNAIGKQLRYPPEDTKRPWRTVVGIVGDVKQYSLDGSATMQFYIPQRQDPTNYMTLAIKSQRQPGELIREVREQVRTLDADVAVADPELLTKILSDSIQTRQLTTWLLLSFAGLALLLASIGIYGVLSYLVSQRTREIGLRMALGATPGNIFKMVLRQGLGSVCIGLAVGLLLAMAAGRSISTMLFAVKSYDTFTFSTITVLLGTVAIVATYLPARSATAIDPMEALRSE